MRYGHIRTAGLIALAACGVFSAPVDATPYFRQVEIQLKAIEDIIGKDDYVLVGERYYSFLNARDSVDLPMELEGGVPYIIIGVCDADCADLDMTLFNSSGSRVVRDIGNDDLPVLRHKPERYTPTSHSVRVRMSRCAEDPCVYAVGVYEPKPREPRQRRR